MVKVLFDENSPPGLAKALHLLFEGEGHEAHHIFDKFGAGIEDIVLFDALGKEKDWILITKDKSQTTRRGKKQAEREAIFRNRVVAFYMSSALGKMYITQQAAVILWQWPRILELTRSVGRGVFLMPVNKGSKFRTM